MKVFIILYLTVFWESLCHLSYTEQYHLKITILWLLPFLLGLLYFFLLSWCSNQTSNTTLNRNGKRRHLCLFHKFRDTQPLLHWYEFLLSQVSLGPLLWEDSTFLQNLPSICWGVHMIYFFVLEFTYVVYCIHFIDCPVSNQISH